MKNILMMPFLMQHHYGYNPEYENLSEEDKYYLDYVDKCLFESDEKFSNACTKAMLLILELLSKVDTNQEPSNEEVELKKEKILSEFSKEDQERLELFMYACIQTIGIYSEDEIKKRKTNKEKMLVKTPKHIKDKK